jgi:hypothetical protein
MSHDDAIEFAITWDYRCPFARNAHEHVLCGLQDGAPWKVTFLAFSLGQVHVASGDPDVWDNPSADSGIGALMAGVAVRDTQPEHFLAAHGALFAARHDQGIDLRDTAAVDGVLASAGVDTTALRDEVASGRPMATIKAEHTAWATSHHVWGVPTFIAGDQAVFVRLMHRPLGDAKEARRSIERVVDLLAWGDLNEFKHTSIPR